MADMGSGYRAAVLSSEPWADTVTITAGRWVNDSVHAVTELGPSGVKWEVLAGDGQFNPPVLRIPDGVARALLDALAQHYGGTSDTRTLRADYMAERARVDRLIELALRAGDGERR